MEMIYLNLISMALACAWAILLHRQHHQAMNRGNFSDKCLEQARWRKKSMRIAYVLTGVLILFLITAVLTAADKLNAI